MRCVTNYGDERVRFGLWGCGFVVGAGREVGFEPVLEILRERSVPILRTHNETGQTAMEVDNYCWLCLLQSGYSRYPLPLILLSSRPSQQSIEQVHLETRGRMTSFDPLYQRRNS